MLVNELRSQIGRECKERGEIFYKLWKAYFKELAIEAKCMVNNKNKLISSIIKEAHKLKSVINNKSLKISELESRILENACIVERFESVQQCTKDLLKIEQTKGEKLQDSISKLYSEIAFWLPGFANYSKDYSIRDKLESILPDRVNNIEDKDFTQTDFIFYGDVHRLTQVLDDKLKSKVKLEQAEGKIRIISSELDQIKTKYERIENDYKNLMKENHIKNQKINDLSSKIEELEHFEKEQIEKIKLLDINSKEIQTIELDAYLGLIENAKDYEKSRLLQRKSNILGPDFTFMQKLDSSQMYTDKNIAVNICLISNLYIVDDKAVSKVLKARCV